MKEEEQEEEKEEEEETEEARNVDGEQLVKKGSPFPFVSIQVFFNSFFPSSPSPGRTTTTTHPLCLKNTSLKRRESSERWCPLAAFFGYV
jgi:hypothetical protein